MAHLCCSPFANVPLQERVLTGGSIGMNHPKLYILGSRRNQRHMPQQPSHSNSNIIKLTGLDGNTANKSQPSDAAIKTSHSKSTSVKYFYCVT